MKGGFAHAWACLACTLTFSKDPSLAKDIMIDISRVFSASFSKGPWI